MTRQQIEQFISVYNALLTIPTRGEDTKVMAQILTIMENLAKTIKVNEKPAVEETSIMEGE